MEIWQNGVLGIIVNGEFRPIPMGGSGLDGVLGQNQDVDEDVDDEDEDEDDDDDDDFVNGVLQEVPEEHRSLVEPYFQKWNGQVTKRFQDYSSQLADYRQLGEPDELQQAIEIYEYLQNSPQEFYQALKQQFDQQQPAPNQGSEQPVPPTNSSNLQGLPPEVQQKFDQYETVLNLLAQDHLERQRREQEAQEDAELDQLLTELHEQYGDFDEEYVLIKMGNGMSADKAMKSYQKFVNAQLEKALAATNGAPTVLSSDGGGAAPGNDLPQRMGDYSSKDIQAVVAQLMGQTAAQGR